VPVRPGTGAVEQDRPTLTIADRSVDRPAHGGRKRDEHDLGALADHPQHAVAVFLAEIVDVSRAGFEDPQPEQAEHRDHGEVERVGRRPGRDEHRLELQVRQAQGGRLGRNRGPAPYAAGE
jgi:hypothetical protein